MKVALFHNPRAGNASFKVSSIVHQLEARGHNVLYKSIKDADWQDAFAEQLDRAILAGGDGTVSRLAPWLAARNVPFCILPLGTANNCARGLRQTHSVEEVVAKFDSAYISKIDLGLLTSPVGHRFFIESTGIGVLALSINEMQSLQKKNGRNLQKPSGKRLADAQESLLSVAESMPAFECEFLLNEEKVIGNFLLIEISNTGIVGPGLELAPSADPSDGLFEVVWVRKVGRQELLTYLEQLWKGQNPEPPFERRRCERLTFRISDAPLHVDGKVFSRAATPLCITVHPGALQLINFARITLEGDVIDRGKVSPLERGSLFDPFL